MTLKRVNKSKGDRIGVTFGPGLVLKGTMVTDVEFGGDESGVEWEFGFTPDIKKNRHQVVKRKSGRIDVYEMKPEMAHRDVELVRNPE